MFCVLMSLIALYQSRTKSVVCSIWVLPRRRRLALNIRDVYAILQRRRQFRVRTHLHFTSRRTFPYALRTLARSVGTFCRNSRSRNLRLCIIGKPARFRHYRQRNRANWCWNVCTAGLLPLSAGVKCARARCLNFSGMWRSHICRQVKRLRSRSLQTSPSPRCTCVM